LVLIPSLFLRRAMQVPTAPSKPRFVTDSRGVINLGAVMGIAGTILVAIVALIFIGALAGPFFDAGGSVVENISNADLGDDLTPALSPVLAMLAAVAILFGLVGLVFLAIRFRRS
jgi:hypothetical protein